MTTILAIAAGGAIGALLRFWIAGGVQSLAGGTFPLGTLVVNLSGSLAMGLLYVLLIERLEVGAEWRAGLLVGVLGAYTTFSTFSIETLNLIEAGQAFQAGLNVIFSVSLCVLGCWAGMVGGRAL
jgi:CrcB protein